MKGTHIERNARGYDEVYRGSKAMQWGQNITT